MAATASKIQICNAALGLLAANRIMSLNDSDSTESMLCTDFYDMVQEEVLEAADWSFAKEYVILSPSSTDPEFKWDYQFTIPSDCVRVIAVYDDPDAESKPKYERVGNTIVCNSNPIYVVYIKALTDTTKMSPLFREALYTKLAAKLAMPLTEDVRKESLFNKRANERLDEAATLDGLQGSQETITHSTFVDVR